MPVGCGVGERAVGAPGRPWLDGPGLRGLVEEVGGALNAVGVGRGDRVGIVLPNGPEAATGFVTVACACTAAPLNPAYKAEEFEFYLSDLKPRAVVARAGAVAGIPSAPSSSTAPGSVHGAPVIGAAVPGNGQLRVAFTPPASTGGLPITGYTANCGARSASGSASPGCSGRSTTASGTSGRRSTRLPPTGR